MAEINLEIAGEPGRISANALKTGVQQTVGLLDEYAHAMSDKGYGFVRWNVREISSNGMLKIGFSSLLIRGRRKVPPVDNSFSVASTLVRGIATIDKEAITPPYISDFGIRRVESFVKLIDRQEANSFTLKSQGLSASVTKETGASIAKLIEIKRMAIGSVEGRLVGIDISRKTRLSIIHQVTKRSISCVVDGKYLEFARSALGKRVIIRGTLFKNINGDTVRVQMRDDEMYVFSTDALRDQLMSLSDLSIPDFAKSSDTEEYLAGSRGASTVR